MSNKSINLTDELYSYLCDVSLRESELLKNLRLKTAKMEEAGLQISPEQGQFMNLLIKLIGAKKTLEVGVFTGYSSISVALALPEDGKLYALDISDKYTSIAKPFWKEAKVDGKINLTIASAIDTLKSMQTNEHIGTFDFAFVDADKVGYDSYYELILPLVRTNGLIIFDNVLRDGKVIDSKIDDPDTVAIRSLNKKLLSDERVEISMLPIADGLTLVRKI